MIRMGWYYTEVKDKRAHDLIYFPFWICTLENGYMCLSAHI